MSVTETKTMSRLEEGTNKGAWDLKLDLYPTTINPSTQRQFRIPLNDKGCSGNIILDLNDIQKAQPKNPVVIPTNGFFKLKELNKHTYSYDLYEEADGNWYYGEVLQRIPNIGNNLGFVKNPYLSIQRKKLDDRWMTNWKLKIKTGKNVFSGNVDLANNVQWLTNDYTKDKNIIFTNTDLDDYIGTLNNSSSKYYIVAEYHKNYPSPETLYRVLGSNNTIWANNDGSPASPLDSFPSAYNPKNDFDGASLFYNTSDGWNFICGYVYGSEIIPYNGSGTPPLILTRIGLLLEVGYILAKSGGWTGEVQFAYLEAECDFKEYTEFRRGDDPYAV